MCAAEAVDEIKPEQGMGQHHNSLLVNTLMVWDLMVAIITPYGLINNCNNP